MNKHISIEIHRELPPVGQTVIVCGGEAYWNGTDWISETVGSEGRPIAWRVDWWTPKLYSKDVPCDHVRVF